MRPIRFTYPASSANAICLTQQPAAGVPLVINGALLDGVTFGLTNQRLAKLTADIQRRLVITGTGLNGCNFVFVGYDANGNLRTESLAGPAAGTALTVNEYALVVSITPDATVAQNLTVGTSAEGHSAVIPVDLYANTTSIGMVGINVSGAVTWTVQSTGDDVFAQGYDQLAGNWLNHPTLAALVASANGNYAYPPNGIRVALNGTGVFQFTLNQTNP